MPDAEPTTTTKPVVAAEDLKDLDIDAIGAAEGDDDPEASEAEAWAEADQADQASGRKDVGSGETGAGGYLGDAGALAGGEPSQQKGDDESPDGAAETDSPESTDEKLEKPDPAAAVDWSDDKTWADLPAGARQAYQDAIHGSRSNAGRVAALQRQVDEARRATTAKPDPKTLDGAEGEVDGALTDSALETEEWKKFADEYPEIADVITSSIAGPISERLAKIEQSLSLVDQDRRQQFVNGEEARARELAPQLDDVLINHKAEFVDWAKAQPPYILDEVIRNAKQIVDAESAADLISRFVASRDQDNHSDPNGSPTEKTPGDASPRRALQLDGARSGRTSGLQPAPKRKGREPETEEEAWALADLEEAETQKRGF